ncbi:Fe-S cluster assembly protein SufD [Arthrobacter sp. AL08]|uniref:Fe-S cluster assembly protein SufD n=1 Tax=Micrococcaceae TaxID=1268 RepID=UPI001CFFC1AC|nr:MULTISPECIES: Fe-S cluster assembly protein SufD [Micrococcaceae]MCB5282287.1 FeS cluster assembly protein SufD [Arthrobacter sp. ES1]MDI3241833.1 Fe-S cluster assembly protein SufD [Arthrobacter sp. AL05]MDI3277843.1 Fe-S cluster assembly protein SufD [Arthrobacter sp. AL08]MDJ0351783.1 Fe-S cluster assembly protein SufD [Pseudarthrobacter sp. PH31-O2]WGZ81086.1 Fe-S cluster assembly protein SufD [Arthrobacter sp. EM1]
MTDITTEKARIGAPSAQPFINGFTEEGESLSPLNSAESKSPLAGEAVKAHSHGGGVGIPDSSRAGRLTSYKLADFKPLTGMEEDWRFTPLKRLRGLHTDVLDGAAPTVSVTAPESVVVETVGREDRRIGSAAIPEDRVSANAWENFTEATVITVPAEVQVEGEVSVLLTGQGTEASAQHLVIVAEQFSKSVIVLDHQGTAVVSENIEILVGDGAQLTVISLQEWNDDAVHASSQQVKLGRDAKFKHIVVSLGGDLVRVTPSARFTAPGAEVELFGLYFADAGQHLEQRLFVDHAVANCKSNVLYKGALQGRNAHAVWVGDVLIRKEAEGTDTYEANRNLVLTDGARADSVPNLEIETGLIAGAGHASATGRFDDQHLFYLMARGIPEEVARRLVVRGFLNEIIQQIQVPAIEERLTEAVERELAATEN